MIVVTTCMEDDLREKYIMLIDRITQHPISFMFTKHMENQKKMYPKYSQVVSHPINLKVIRTNVVRNKYESMDQFWDDLDLMAANAKTYFGKKSYFFMASNMIIDIAHKEAKNLGIFQDISKWSQQVLSFRTKMISLLNSQPHFDDLPINKSKKISTQLNTIDSLKLLKSLIDKAPLEKKMDVYKKIVEAQPELATSGSILNVELMNVYPNVLNQLVEELNL